MLTERKGQNRAGGGAAHAWQRGDFIEGLWEFSAVQGGHLLRRFMQIARAGVIAKSGPKMQDFIEGAFARSVIVGKRAIKRSK